MKTRSNQSKQNQAVRQFALIPESEWENVKQDIKYLKESSNSFSTNPLGDWLNEVDAQKLLNKKHTSLWRLRKNGIVKSERIGGSNYYSKQSLIDYLNNK